MKRIDLSFSMNGRTRRSVFWRTLILLLVAWFILTPIACIIIDKVSGVFLVILVYLLFAVPLIARRAQDAGLSDGIKYSLIGATVVFMPLYTWYTFLAEALPMGYLIVHSFYGVSFIYAMSNDSQPGANKWGPNPKELDNASGPESTPAPEPPAPAAEPIVPESTPAPEPPAPAAETPAPAGTPAICTVCGGKGVNAAGYTCPVCGGAGVAK